MTSNILKYFIKNIVNNSNLSYREKEFLSHHIIFIVKNYSKYLKRSQKDVLTSLERARFKSDLHDFYKKLTPLNDQILVVKNNQEFNRIFSSGKFQCPYCGMDGENSIKCVHCSWTFGYKYQLYPTLNFIFIENFINEFKIYRQFLPVEFC